MPQEPEYLQPANGGKGHSSGIRPILAMKRFMLSRWRGEAPLATVFWGGIMLTGSMINAVATLAMMALLASKALIIVALFVFFVPLPLSFFFLHRGMAQRRARG